MIGVVTGVCRNRWSDVVKFALALEDSVLSKHLLTGSQERPSKMNQLPVQLRPRLCRHTRIVDECMQGLQIF